MSKTNKKSINATYVIYTFILYVLYQKNVLNYLHIYKHIYILDIYICLNLYLSTSAQTKYCVKICEEVFIKLLSLLSIQFYSMKL